MVRGGVAYAGRLVLLAALYVLAAKVAFALAFVHTSISPVWLPSGLAVAAVAVFGWRAAPGVWLGAFIFNALTPVPMWVALLIAVGNALEALTAGWLLRRVGFRLQMDRVRDVLALAGLGALTATAVSATIGVATLLGAGIEPWQKAGHGWLLWWSGDAVGVLTVTPLLLLVWATRRDRGRWRPRRLVEAGALALVLPPIVWLALTPGPVRPFVVFPVLVWAAIRFRRAGANVASLFVSAVGVYASAHGHAVWVESSLDENLLDIQTYVAVVMATSLLLAAMTVEREQATEALRRATAVIELRNSELEAERVQLDEAQRLTHVGSWEWDVATDTVHWSDETYRIYGLGPQWVGLDYEGFIQRVHPDDRDRIDQTIRATYASGSQLSFEHRIVRPDGEPRVVHGRGIVIRDETGAVVRMLGTEQDITERTRVEQALRLQQEQTRAIIDTAGDPFVSMDERGVITDWNRSAEALFGWAAEEAIGRTLADTIIPPSFRQAHRTELRRVVAGGTPRLLGKRVEMTALHRDGHEIPVELVAWRVRSEAGQHFHAFVHDVTERRQFEEALAAARDEALEASRLKSQFLATMSHEIRTPMNGVIGLAGLLLAGPIDGAQRRQVEGIRGAGETLLAIINDVLDFSKIEAGRLVLDDLDFDLDTVISQTVDLLAEAANAKGLTLVGARQPDLPAALRGDPTRLRQILLNLVSNAVKFTPAGGVTVRAGLADPADADADADAVAGADGRLAVRIEVTDTGIGIPAGKQAHLFDPFVQADASTTREYGGTGLGLAICRRLAEAMGGHLEVSSRPGHGSTFSCLVPLAIAVAAPEAVPVVAGSTPVVQVPVPALPAAVPVGAEGVPADQTRLLLVEDNRLNQLVAVEILTRLGYRVDVAANGREALRLAAATRYQVILMDCQMPVMDGYAATAALRRMEGADRHTPIIAMTAGAFDEDRRRCLAAGMDDFLAKPFDLGQLRETVARWTSQPAEAVTDPA